LLKNCLCLCLLFPQIRCHGVRLHAYIFLRRDHVSDGNVKCKGNLRTFSSLWVTSKARNFEIYFARQTSFCYSTRTGCRQGTEMTAVDVDGLHPSSECGCCNWKTNMRFDPDSRVRCRREYHISASKDDPSVSVIPSRNFTRGFPKGQGFDLSL